MLDNNGTLISVMDLPLLLYIHHDIKNPLTLKTADTLYMLDLQWVCKC